MVDKTGCSVQMTLWGKQAESFSADQGSVGAFKGIRVGDFGGEYPDALQIMKLLIPPGVSLSMITSSHMQIDPAIPECYTLRGWYDSQGADMSFQSKTVIGGGGGPAISFNRAEARSLSEIKESDLGMGDKPDFFCTRGTVVHVRGENISYPACTNSNCNKKMTMEGDSWVCDKCGNRADAPDYRSVGAAPSRLLAEG